MSGNWRSKSSTSLLDSGPDSPPSDNFILNMALGLELQQCRHTVAASPHILLKVCLEGASDMAEGEMTPEDYGAAGFLALQLKSRQLVTTGLATTLSLSDSKSLSGGVGKVASQSVVLNGVMNWGTDKVGGCIAHNSTSWGYSHGASTGKSDERGGKQEDEGLAC